MLGLQFFKRRLCWQAYTSRNEPPYAPYTTKNLGMILVERNLSASEQAQLPNDIAHIDLRQTLESSTYQTALFAWLDAPNATTLDGKPLATALSLSGRSYWLHVRGRVFYTLLRQAQLLDRLPSSLVFEDVKAIYALAAHRSFWQTWFPHAAIYTEASPPSLSSQTAVLDHRYFIWLAKQALKSRRPPPTDVVVFSNIFYNQTQAAGPMPDTHLHSLLENLSKNHKILRLELMPLPPKGVSLSLADLQPRERAYPNETLDVLLAHYLRRHPLKLLRLFRAYKRLKKEISDATITVQTQKFPTIDAIKTVLKQTTASILGCELCFLAVRDWLKHQKPKWVIGTSENNSIGRTVIEAAKSLQIPTAGLQHGAIEAHNADYRFHPSEMPHAAPDVFFAWGEETRAYLLRQSHYTPKNTYAVGRLQADLLGMPSPDPHLTAFKNRTKRPLLLFASHAQGLFDEYRLMVAPLLAQFCKENGLACVVKPHPRETDDGIYRKAFEAAGLSAALLEATGDLYAMIAASDFGAACYSTVAWEMLWKGLPLIIFDPLHLNLLNLRKETAVFFADETRSFQDWQASLPQHQAAGQALAIARLGPADGQTAARIIAHLFKD